MRQPKDVIIGDNTLEEILKTHAERDDLHAIDLHDVDLSHVNFTGVNLCNAYLFGANLHGANLYNADLSCADLSCADLSCAYLCNANLCNAKLWYANLHNAYLLDADLHDANLSGANLYGTDFYNAKGSFIEYRKGKILTQNIVGYKKCIGGHGNVIVTLEIPRGAIVFSINGYKFRTNKAKVIGLDGANRAKSFYQDMTYYMWDEFTIDNFNCAYNVECGAGIHFFMTREEAENYDEF